MDKQAQEAKQMAREMPLNDRLKHYWEYYKAQIIAVTASVILIIVSVVGAVTAEKYDIEISYYGQRLISEEQEAALEEYIAKYIEDINGDGECKVDILVSRSGLAHAEDEYQMALAQKFATEVATGAYPVFILDKPHIDYAGMADERTEGIIESVADMRNNSDVAAILDGFEDDIYWCTRVLYDKEIGKKLPEALHKNAIEIEELFR